ncbi:MAG: lactate dehydrogenase [Lachnospiraceae bacterium]|nr:lactate dehydrogenase [Lachnospiraceae bacterium]
MITFYNVNGHICFSDLADLAFEKAAEPKNAETLTWLFQREPGSCRASFKVNNKMLLSAPEENVSWLNSNKLEKLAPVEIPAWVEEMIAAGKVRAVNASHPRFEEILAFQPKEGKKRVHVLAIGDVGSMLLTGLHLLGGDVISSIGICDISEQVTARWEFEENQIAYPWDYDALPEVDIVKPEQLFDCDVFVFVASKGIPPVGSGIKDVRMYQFENNSKIIGHYAKMAREKNFKGLFCAVSDPVDPLAKTAFLESNKNENGELDYMGLLPEQIQGFGLGVMNARAAYYAKRDERFTQFLTEGRSFGPHGQDLVVADSIENYNDELSKELTQLTVTANLHMRAIGYKPFVAPAFSSGAISILMCLRGQWHCGSVFLGGIYMGVKNRYTANGLEAEILPLPDALYDRIVFAEENLKAII